MVAGPVLRRTLRGQWRLVVAGGLLAAGHQAGEALVPVVIGVVIDRAVSTGDAGALITWLAVLAVVFAILSYSYRFAARTAERGIEQASHGIRLDLAGRVLGPRGGAETGRLPGELVSVATNDARRAAGVVVVLDAGRVVETGTHATLAVRPGGHYAGLWAAYAAPRQPGTADRT